MLYLCHKVCQFRYPRLEVVNLVKHIFFCKSVQFFTMLTEIILIFFLTSWQRVLTRPIELLSVSVTNFLPILNLKELLHIIICQFLVKKILFQQKWAKLVTLIKALWESPQKTNILSVGNCSLKEMKDSQKTRFGILWFLRKSCGKYLFLRKKKFSQRLC